VRVFLTVRRMVMKLWRKIPKLQMKRMKIALLCLTAISRTMRYSTKQVMSLANLSTSMVLVRCSF
jgi:hypothetical protein